VRMHVRDISPDYAKVEHLTANETDVSKDSK